MSKFQFLRLRTRARGFRRDNLIWFLFGAYVAIWTITMILYNAE